MIFSVRARLSAQVRGWHCAVEVLTQRLERAVRKLSIELSTAEEVLQILYRTKTLRGIRVANVVSGALQNIARTIRIVSVFLRFSQQFFGSAGKYTISDQFTENADRACLHLSPSSVCRALFDQFFSLFQRVNQMMVNAVINVPLFRVERILSTRSALIPATEIPYTVHNSPRSIRIFTRAASFDCTRPCWCVRPIMCWYSLTWPARRCSAAISAFIASISRIRPARSASVSAFTKSLAISSTVLMASILGAFSSSINRNLTLVPRCEYA